MRYFPALSFADATIAANHFRMEDVGRRVAAVNGWKIFTKSDAKTLTI